jgi:6,7-dimethyl-8-ribityllumazine synthase
MTNDQAHDLSAMAYQGKGDHQQDRVVMVVSKWNTEVTEALFRGAKQVLSEQGLRPENMLRFDVPGSFELPMGADLAFNKYPKLDGVICLGCLVQGETRHFEFIAQAVSQGVMRVGLDHRKPAIFGVLTTDNQAQALARAGGSLGNKGAEAAIALLEMIDLEHA